MSRIARWPAGLAAAVLALVLLALPAAAQTPDAIRRAAAETVKELSLQTELPREPAKPTDESWLVRALRWIFDAGGYGNRTVITLFLILGVAVLIFAFRDQLLMLLGRNDKWQAAANGEDAERLTRESAAKTWAAADDLARQGLFREAMHILLLRALAEMRLRRGEHFADSLTSREVLHQVKLPELGHTSLRDIITRVEWTYFGEHPAAADDYSACRASFVHFVEALQEAHA